MAGIDVLSTEDIIRIARTRFIQLSSQGCLDISMFRHPFDGAYCNLSAEDIKNVELALLLLASAEEVGKQQFDSAIKFLNLCGFLSSNRGNSVQRVVHYFKKALQERIDRETGRVTPRFKRIEKQLLHSEEKIITSHPAVITCSLQLPFVLASQFGGIQVIIESVASGKKIHLIDFSIRSGGHCTALMQALAARNECPLELLKITAVATTSKQMIEETGERLACFAETLGIPFSFKIAMVSDIKDIKEDIFEINDGEIVAISFRLMLRHLVSKPGCLESVLRVLRNLNPRVIAIIEFDAHHISPIFIDRFYETLFSYSAYFDSLDSCVHRCDPNRLTMESLFLSQEIQNIIATEGEERIFRHMKIDAWRDYLKGFGMMERELSMSTLYQTELVARKFARGSSCTLDKNGKCLTVGWKGRAILSLSAWKFRKVKNL